MVTYNSFLESDFLILNNTTGGCKVLVGQSGMDLVIHLTPSTMMR